MSHAVPVPTVRLELPLALARQLYDLLVDERPTVERSAAPRPVPDLVVARLHRVLREEQTRRGGRL